MPRKKPKLAHEMTGDEIAKRVFPKEVHSQLKRIANPEPKLRKSPQPKSKEV